MDEKEVIDALIMQKSLKETYEILNQLDKEEYNKIPDDFISYVRDNMDNDYDWKYDETKSLEEQNLSEYTIPILANINYDYLLNDEQKDVVKKMYEVNEEISKLDTNESENASLTIQEKPSFISRIISQIKKIFGKRG